MNRVFISVVLVFVSSFCSSQGRPEQIDGIDMQCYQIVRSSMFQDSGQVIFNLDSVYIRCSKDRIKASIVSVSDSSSLEIDYFYQSGNVIKVVVKEQSPYFNDMARFSSFYFDQDSVLFVDHRMTVRPCIEHPVDADFYKFYGYKDSYTEEYLSRYILELHRAFNCSQQGFGKSRAVLASPREMKRAYL